MHSKKLSESVVNANWMAEACCDFSALLFEICSEFSSILALVQWYYIEAKRLGSVVLLIPGREHSIHSEGWFSLAGNSVLLCEALERRDEFPICC